MEKTADVVIIGGGIIGLSIAYHLALSGERKVVVVERNLICSGSSGLRRGGFASSSPRP
jgi:sarcosine oxidase subunit beta